MNASTKFDKFWYLEKLPSQTPNKKHILPNVNTVISHAQTHDTQLSLHMSISTAKIQNVHWTRAETVTGLCF